jgi:hypothetical protein
MATPIAVTILYFPDTAVTGDVDNIIKPILDALRPGLYLDDAPGRKGQDSEVRAGKHTDIPENRAWAKCRLSDAQFGDSQK